jgi:hypothetical protein
MSLENRLKQLNKLAELPVPPNIPMVPDNINAWKRGFSKFKLPKGYPKGAELLRIRDPAPLKPSIYLLFAHGCDLGVEYPVPENCMYVTKAICGELNTVTEKDIDFFKDFQDKDKIFNNPVDNIDELEERYLTSKCSIKRNTNIKNTIGKLKSGRACQTIHVKHSEAVSDEMRHYANAIFTPYFSHFAGLYKIGSPLFETKKFSVLTGSWTCDVCSFINTCARAEPTCQICESPMPKGVCTDMVEMPIGSQQALFVRDILEEGDDVAEKIISYLSGLYEHSIFPTATDVEEVLRSVSFPPKPPADIDQNPIWIAMFILDKFTDLITKNFRVDLETLFKYFPGIYYSFGCRGPCGADDELSKMENAEAAYPAQVLRRERSLRGRIKENLAPRTLESARRRALTESNKRLKNISARKRALMKGGRSSKTRKTKALP